MKNYLAEIESKLSIEGTITTILVHALLLLVLFFYVLDKPLKEKSVEGILINFGTDEDGSGEQQPLANLITPQEESEEVIQEDVVPEEVVEEVAEEMPVEDAEPPSAAATPDQEAPVGVTNNKVQTIDDPNKLALPKKSETKKKKNSKKKEPTPKPKTKPKKKPAPKKDTSTKKKKTETKKEAKKEAPKKKPPKVQPKKTTKKEVPKVQPKKPAPKKPKPVEKKTEEPVVQPAKKPVVQPKKATPAPKVKPKPVPQPPKSAPKPEAKPTKPEPPAKTKPKEPTIDQTGLMSKNKNKSKSQGSKTKNSDLGSKMGTDKPSDNKGNKSYGKGKTGVGWDLKGRSMVKKPTISDNSSYKGTIKVKIKVNRQGKVVDADFQSLGSTTHNSTLKSKAIAAAKRATFNRVDKGPEIQSGTMTFNFKVK